MKIKLRYIVIPLAAWLAFHHITLAIQYAGEVAAKAEAYDGDGCARYEAAMYKMVEYKLPVGETK